MDPSRIEYRIKKVFDKMVRSDQKIHNAHLLVHSDFNQIHLNLAGENSKKRVQNPVTVGQPVFMASVGKLFTATIIAILYEQHMLSFHSPIIDFIDHDLLNGLHVYKSIDYSDHIQIRHLLNHTSGLPDYFEDKPKIGQRMVEKILTESEHLYLPGEIINWSKENLKAKFPPGMGFHYSDTGYQLLGLVIEAVTGLPFSEALKQFIFEPLSMTQAFLIGHSQPHKACSLSVAGVYFKDTNIVEYPSMSMDYAGGGITAPLEDLLKFMQALAQGKIINRQTFQKMNNRSRFVPGIDYCYGFMKIKPVPLLMPAKYSCWGNAGSTGAFMFYHPGLDTTLIGSLNQFRHHQQGIQFMFRVIDAISKEII